MDGHTSVGIHSLMDWRFQTGQFWTPYLPGPHFWLGKTKQRPIRWESLDAVHAISCLMRISEFSRSATFWRREKNRLGPAQIHLQAFWTAKSSASAVTCHQTDWWLLSQFPIVSTSFQAEKKEKHGRQSISAQIPQSLRMLIPIWVRIGVKIFKKKNMKKPPQWNPWCFQLPPQIVSGRNFLAPISYRETTLQPWTITSQSFSRTSLRNLCNFLTLRGLAGLTLEVWPLLGGNNSFIDALQCRWM